jgi:hypothetical protein
MQTNKKK